jgi:hypothetical protein
MQPLARYESNFVDPNLDDAIVDQSDVANQSYRQYKCDTILDSIGLAKSEINIRLFLDEIHFDLDDSALEAFYYEVAKKLNSIYRLDVLDEYFDNKKPLVDYDVSIRSLLLDLEIKYKLYLPEFLKYIDKKEVLDDVKLLYKYLLANYDMFRGKMLVEVESKSKDGFQFSYLFKYFLYYAQKEDLCYCICRLFNKSHATITANTILKEISNVNH